MYFIFYTPLLFHSSFIVTQINLEYKNYFYIKAKRTLRHTLIVENMSRGPVRRGWNEHK